MTPIAAARAGSGANGRIGTIPRPGPAPEADRKSVV